MAGIPEGGLIDFWNGEMGIDMRLPSCLLGSYQGEAMKQVWWDGWNIAGGKLAVNVNKHELELSLEFMQCQWQWWSNLNSFL